MTIQEDEVTSALLKHWARFIVAYKIVYGECHNLSVLSNYKGGVTEVTVEIGPGHRVHPSNSGSSGVVSVLSSGCSA